jgi:hypothetical protein
MAIDVINLIAVPKVSAVVGDHDLSVVLENLTF